MLAKQEFPGLDAATLFKNAAPWAAARPVGQIAQEMRARPVGQIAQEMRGRRNNKPLIRAVALPCEGPVPRLC